MLISAADIVAKLWPTSPPAMSFAVAASAAIYHNIGGCFCCGDECYRKNTRLVFSLHRIALLSVNKIHGATTLPDLIIFSQPTFHAGDAVSSQHQL